MLSRFSGNFPGTQAIGSIFERRRRFLSKNHHRRLLVFGDSNACRPDGNRHCWPAILQHKSGNIFRVINESLDGRTTQFDSGECNGLAVIEKKIRNALPVAFVLVALGTNDLKLVYGPPNGDQVLEGIHRIIKVILKCNRETEVVLVTPSPLGDVTQGDLAGAQHRILSVVSSIRRYATAQRIPLVDLHSIIDADTDLEADHVHLNTRGRKKAADAVWRCILDHDRSPI
jgi:lysophospholipase L1-like esterase